MVTEIAVKEGDITVHHAYPIIRIFNQEHIGIPSFEHSLIEGIWRKKPDHAFIFSEYAGNKTRHKGHEKSQALAWLLNPKQTHMKKPTQAFFFVKPSALELVRCQ